MGFLDDAMKVLDIDLNFDWAELFAVSFVMLGFLAGVFASSPQALVGVVFLIGLMFGRAWFTWKKRGKVPIFLITMGFLLGVLVWFFYVDPRVLVVVFCVGGWLGHAVFKKKLIRSVR